MVMDETYVINQVKEDVCYVSSQFMEDMDIAKKKGKENTIARDYVLPDYTHIKRGYVRPPEETTGKAKDGEQVKVISELCEKSLFGPYILCTEPNLVQTY
uniref:Actin-related protein 6 n=1 Tax=Magallana gigas TaxID=29159 RepID=K1PGR7_MAGGI